MMIDKQHIGVVAVFLGTVGIGVGTLLAHDPGYTISEIGALPGDVLSGANGINRLGEAVGWSENADGDRRAFYWHDGVMEALPTPGDVIAASAAAINDAGLIVGTVTYADLSQHAVAWQDGQFNDLSDLAALGDGMAAGVGQNNIVVGGAYVNALSAERALTWVQGQPNIVGTLVGNSGALDINEANQVVGWAEDGSGQKHAFLADTDDGTFEDLGLFAEGIWSIATAINDDGVVVGYGEIGGEDDGVFAFKWTPQGGVLENLGALGSKQSQAWGVSAAEFIVGSSVLIGTGDVNAVLWRPDRMINLNSLLLPGSDWDYLIEANAINDEGQIVGRGMIDGDVHAFLLEPVVGMVSPVPGIAGQLNTFDAAGAKPGNIVHFAYGFAWGDRKVPGCPGRLFNIKNPKLLKSKRADDIGHAIFEIMIPKAAKNKAVIFQAFEPATCEVSVPITWTFH